MNHLLGSSTTYRIATTRILSRYSKVNIEIVTILIWRRITLVFVLKSGSVSIENCRYVRPYGTVYASSCVGGLPGLEQA